jgi:methyl-accepting chemotaxis protein
MNEVVRCDARAQKKSSIGISAGPGCYGFDVSVAGPRRIKTNQPFLTTLQSQIGRGIAAAVDIAAHAPQLVQIAADTERGGAVLVDSSALIASASEQESVTLQRELAPRANAVAGLSRAVASAIGACERESQVVAQQVEAINSSEHELTAAVQRLEGPLTEIGQVIDVIAHISRQINLLALNAAIEAARAGRGTCI